MVTLNLCFPPINFRFSLLMTFVNRRLSSKPTGVSNMGCGEGRGFSQWKQLDCERTRWQLNHETAWLWGCLGATVLGLHFSRGRRSLQWELIVHSMETGGSWIIKSSHLSPGLALLMKMRTPNHHSWIGPKSAVLIGWDGAPLIG